MCAGKARVRIRVWEYRVGKGRGKKMKTKRQQTLVQPRRMRRKESQGMNGWVHLQLQHRVATVTPTGGKRSLGTNAKE